MTRPTDLSIDYSEPAVYSRRENGTWISYGSLPLDQAIRLALRKYRMTEEPIVSSKGLHLIGIDAIHAVRQRTDFPSLEKQPISRSNQ